MVFVASGRRLGEAKQFARKYLKKNQVIFKPLVDIDLLPFTMGLADLAYVSLRSNFQGNVVPSKFSGYLARGIPMIYVGPDSEIKKILRT